MTPDCHPQGYKKLPRLGFCLATAVLLVSLPLITSSCSTSPAKKKVNAPKIRIRRVRQAAWTGKPDEPLNVLLLGSDSRTESTEGRSDSIMLVHLDPKGKSSFAVSFPRDSKVTIPGHGTNKINAAMFYGGTKLTVKTIENLTGIKIDYYAVTTFIGFARIINNLGGVQITLDQPLKDTWAGADFAAGSQKFTGEDALAFCRARHIAQGDFTRAAHQQDLALAVFEQERQKKEPQDLLKLINIIMNDCDTNLSYTEIFRLAKAAMQVQPDRISGLVLPGGTATVGGTSYVILDQSELEKTFQKIKVPAQQTQQEDTTP